MKTEKQNEMKEKVNGCMRDYHGDDHGEKDFFVRLK